MHTARGASGLTRANRRGDLFYLVENDLSKFVCLTVAFGIDRFEKVKDRLRSEGIEVLCEDRTFLSISRKIVFCELPFDLLIRHDLVVRSHGLPTPGTHLAGLIGKRSLRIIVALPRRET